MSDSPHNLSAASEPIHWCDLFRDLERVGMTDPRYASRAVLDPKAEARRMTIEDHWRDINTLALHGGVPNVIRVHYETARNLLLHSWFVFRFQQVAEMHAYASVEFALRMRAGLPLRGHHPGLRRLLTQAAEVDWIRAEGFRRCREAAARRTEYEEMEAQMTARSPTRIGAQTGGTFACSPSCSPSSGTSWRTGARSWVRRASGPSRCAAT